MTAATLEERKREWLHGGEIYLTPDEIAGRYRVTRDTVIKWMSRGVNAASGRVYLKNLKIGDRLRSTPEWCEEFHNAMNPEAVPVAEPTRTTDARARRDRDEAARALGGKREK